MFLFLSKNSSIIVKNYSTCKDFGAAISSGVALNLQEAPPIASAL